MLTVGAVAKMLNGDVKSDREMMPTLQVTELKLIQVLQPNQNEDRYRVSLSDGTHSQQGMLNTTLNDLVKQGNIQVGSVLRLTQFVCNLIGNRRLVIILGLEIIEEKFNIIRNPNDSGESYIDQGRGAVSVNKQSVVSFEKQEDLLVGCCCLGFFCLLPLSFLPRLRKLLRSSPWPF